MSRRAIQTCLLSTVVLFLWASAASASVRVVRFTSRVSPNDYASLTVTVSPGSSCRITVTYDTVVSRAHGLGTKRGGSITWTWKVGSNTHDGKWPVAVDCGKSGKVRRFLTVVG